MRTFYAYRVLASYTILQLYEYLSVFTMILLLLRVRVHSSSTIALLSAINAHDTMPVDKTESAVNLWPCCVDDTACCSIMVGDERH